MSFDLQSAQIAVAILLGVLTILGTIFGWFGSTWRWIQTQTSRRRHRGSVQDNGHMMKLVYLIVGALVWVASAVAVACLTKSYFVAVPLPLAIASMCCFAWSTLARMGGRSWGQKTATERIDRVFFWILYWLGTYLGAVAMLPTA